MTDTMRADDPTLRQKLARMLSGDAKQGSVRAHLADALAGGQVDGSGSALPLLTTATPVGVLTSADEANRAGKKGNFGEMALSAAGMIPGAGKGVGKAAKFAAEHIQEVADMLREMPERKVYDAIINSGLHDDKGAQGLLDAAKKTLPVSEMMAPDEVSQLKNAVAKRRDPNAMGRAEQLDDHLAQIQKRAEGGMSRGETPVQGMRDELEGRMQIRDIAGGDPKKAHFIEQAMQDEGGNVPEEVAQTLLDHIEQRDPARHAKLLMDAEEAGVEPHMTLAETHSIPEMLAMHYDLNPEMMGSAYEMPSTVKPKTRPTQ